jgi:hypothetical protein
VRSAYFKTPGTFTSYFQYKIGDYQPVHYLEKILGEKEIKDITPYYVLCKPFILQEWLFRVRT